MNPKELVDALLEAVTPPEPEKQVVWGQVAANGEIRVAGETATIPLTHSYSEGQKVTLTDLGGYFVITSTFE